MAIKRDELSNPDSCLNRAEDDEPLFVLRANDELASMAVMIWAGHYQISKREAQNGELTEKQQNKYNEAMKLVGEMRAWSKAQSEKIGADA